MLISNSSTTNYFRETQKNRNNSGVFETFTIGILTQGNTFICNGFITRFSKQRQKDSFYQKITNDEKSIYTIRPYYVEHEGNLSGKT